MLEIDKGPRGLCGTQVNREFSWLTEEKKEDAEGVQQRDDDTYFTKEGYFSVLLSIHVVVSLCEKVLNAPKESYIENNNAAKAIIKKK